MYKAVLTRAALCFLFFEKRFFWFYLSLIFHCVSTPHHWC